MYYTTNNSFCEGDDMYFKECPYCGSNLDPGEQCECRDEKVRYLAKFKTSSTGQMVLDFGRESSNGGIQRKLAVGGYR